MPLDRWISRSEASDYGFEEATRRACNATFEREELARFEACFERVLPQSLNDEQRAAIVVDEDATLVVAAAGSGKTTLLLGNFATL
jgi:DNA helicase-4